MAEHQFTVVIAGASIAGLTLALMLQEQGIEYLVLEAYHEIAPQVGASIGLMPNGLRVLDQLGIYESIMKAAEVPISEVNFRRPSGKTFWKMKNFDQLSINRHGYPLVFLDRQQAIAVLYEHIKDKSRVLTSKRVVSVKQSDYGVEVETQDGCSFKGDILIGADGINSAVRQSMWDAAAKLEPGWISPSEIDDVPATYGSVFGVCHGVTELEDGVLHSSFNKHFSYLLGAGANGHAYFILFFNLGKTLYGSDVPKFTAEDEERIVREHWDDQLTENLRFGALYQRKVRSVCTPLHEYVFKRWHFGRIMTIGDACHKFEPLTGQGGNSAIETAACLTNHLIEALKKSGSGRLSNGELKSLFESVQAIRAPRAEALVKQSHARQRVDAMETPLLECVANYVLPWTTKSKIFERWMWTYGSAVSLHHLPIPPRPRQVPYDDEVVEKKGSSYALPMSLLLAVSGGVAAFLWSKEMHRHLLF